MQRRRLAAPNAAPPTLATAGSSCLTRTVSLQMKERPVCLFQPEATTIRASSGSWCADPRPENTSHMGSSYPTYATVLVIHYPVRLRVWQPSQLIQMLLRQLHSLRRLSRARQFTLLYNGRLEIKTSNCSQKDKRRSVGPSDGSALTAAGPCGLSVQLQPAQKKDKPAMKTAGCESRLWFVLG